MWDGSGGSNRRALTFTPVSLSLQSGSDILKREIKSLLHDGGFCTASRSLGSESPSCTLGAVPCIWGLKEQGVSTEGRSSGETGLVAGSQEWTVAAPEAGRTYAWRPQPASEAWRPWPGGWGERLQGAGLPPQAPGFLPTLRFPQVCLASGPSH